MNNFEIGYIIKYRFGTEEELKDDIYGPSWSDWKYIYCSNEKELGDNQFKIKNDFKKNEYYYFFEAEIYRADLTFLKKETF